MIREDEKNSINMLEEGIYISPKFEKDLLPEFELSKEFFEEIYSMPSGEKVKECIQCGTCSGSCPSSYLMDHSPRQIFAMIRAGMRKEVLESNTMWYCTSCYYCYVRCPAGIKITDVMYALKRFALKDKDMKVPDNRPVRFMECFSAMVKRYGRNCEAIFTILYYLSTNPFRMLKHAVMGINLFIRGRMPLIPKKIKGADDVKKLMEYVEEMER
ncbi:MAG TPA: 4Fe-4S dicluster domain-containing protein [Firmicutes bacterium]|nr:4Fe-4S dicluster domain-containing protein [Bacillota bacterium]